MRARLWTLNVTIGVFLLLVSWPAFNVLYGSKWDAAVPIFRILIIYGICASMKYFYQTIMKVYDRTRLVRDLTFIQVVLQLGLLAIFFRKGIIAIALTQAVAAVVMCIVHAYYYKRIMGFGIRLMLIELLHACSVPALAFGISVAIAWTWYMHVPALVNGILLCVTFVAAFFGVCAVLRPPYYNTLCDWISVKILHRRSTPNTSEK